MKVGQIKPALGDAGMQIAGFTAATAQTRCAAGTLASSPSADGTVAAERRMIGNLTVSAVGLGCMGMTGACFGSQHREAPP